MITTPELRLAPRQRRAHATLDHVCEAAAQLLETAGPRGFTTNHVAARAGYSIGTLYRWFPDKHALLRLLARREAERQEARVAAALAAAPAEVSLEALARIIVRAALQPFEGRDRLREVLLAVLSERLLAGLARAAQPRLLPLLAAAAHRHCGLALSETGRQALLATPKAGPFELAGAEDRLVGLIVASFTATA